MCLCVYVFKYLSCTTIFQSVEYHSIMIKKIIFFTLLLASCPAFSQPRDEASIKSIFDEALKNGKSYEMLQYLTQNIGPRLSGSPGASSAVAWGKGVMIDWEFDSVWVQPVMVPHWVRGQKEIGKLIGSKKKDTLALSVCALGGSVGTGPEGVKGKIVEVKTFEELAQLGTKNVRGKIVFFNRRMDPTLMNPFLAYQGAVDQRSDGASEAVKYGAIGVIVRSMNSNLEDYPHTGSMKYKPGMPKIPALAPATPTSSANWQKKTRTCNSILRHTVKRSTTCLPSMLSVKSKVESMRTKSLHWVDIWTRGIWPKVRTMMARGVYKRSKPFAYLKPSGTDPKEPFGPYCS